MDWNHITELSSISFPKNYHNNGRESNKFAQILLPHVCHNFPVERPASTRFNSTGGYGITRIPKEWDAVRRKFAY